MSGFVVRVCCKVERQVKFGVRKRASGAQRSDGVQVQSIVLEVEPPTVVAGAWSVVRHTPRDSKTHKIPNPVLIKLMTKVANISTHTHTHLHLG